MSVRVSFCGMADEMENEFMKRGYLLPNGCKDLSDVLKLKVQSATATPHRRSSLASLPPVTGEMTVPSRMTVKELAETLNQKPFQIVGDLMEIGVLATVSQQIDFETISRVARKYGYTAKKEA